MSNQQKANRELAAGSLYPLCALIEILHEKGVVQLEEYRDRLLHHWDEISKQDAGSAREFFFLLDWLKQEIGRHNREGP
jgi:hypothetical protein